MNKTFFMVMLFAGCLLSACATTEVAEESGPTPQQLSQNPDQSLKGQRMTWGGSIISVKNEADSTIIEILAYPLGSSGEPQTDRQSLGRFLADHRGFLEPREYTAGKRVAVSGPLLGYKDGKVGDSAYTYPALSAQEISLYKKAPVASYQRKPRVSVGVGVGSHGRSNVGIGIGF